MAVEMELPQRVFAAGRTIGAAQEDSLADALSDFVSAFVGRPYQAGSAALVGISGQDTEEFACTVFLSGEDPSHAPGDGLVPISCAAAIIDARVELTIDELRSAYARTAAAKRLRQDAGAPKGARQRDDLLAVVLAQRSNLTLETIAKEMERLNAETPATLWPDMVAVADTGLVQYTAQFPGENVSGDFFLPGENLSYAAPMYIVMVMKPAGEHTLNRILSFVAAHLALFAPGSEVPDFPAIVAGIPNTAVSLTGYQCNLAGELVPVPRQFYNDRYLPPTPFVIEDSVGNVLATVQFLQWQNGGVILLRGQLPLGVLLGFLDKNMGKGIVRRPEAQLSFAIPITEGDFQQMLRRFDRQSNMTVRPAEANWVVKKLADEGTSSPFMARLLLSILKLRDAALLDGAERDSFDEAYDAVTTPLLDARARMKRIVRLWKDHTRQVEAGEVVRVRGRTIHVDQTIDPDLGQEVDAFLSAATRSLKAGMQGVARELGPNIGFLFQNLANFEAGLRSLKSRDAALATYLRHTRDHWSETLVQRRNTVEHEGWRLPNVEYVRTDGGVNAKEPNVDGMPVTQFTPFMFDRVSCFIEEVTAHLLQRRLLQGVTIKEVPPAARKPEAPERFRLTVDLDGQVAWIITYHEATFEET